MFFYFIYSKHFFFVWTQNGNNKPAGQQWRHGHRFEKMGSRPWRSDGELTGNGTPRANVQIAPVLHPSSQQKEVSESSKVSAEPEIKIGSELVKESAPDRKPLLFDHPVLPLPSRAALWDHRPHLDFLSTGRFLWRNGGKNQTAAGKQLLKMLAEGQGDMEVTFWGFIWRVEFQFVPGDVDRFHQIFQNGALPSLCAQIGSEFVNWQWFRL